MALTTEQKASFLFKQAQGVAETSIFKDFFEESLKGRILVLNNQLWSASDQIPATAPVLADGAASGVVRYYQARTMNAVAGVSNSFYLEDLKDSIPFNFGDGSYNYAITSSTGTAIPFGQGDWLVNNTTGTLTFYGSVPANMPPKISFYKYIGAKGAGGEAALPAVYVVTTIAERDALTPKQGDLCIVTSENQTYAWSATSWVLIQSAGAVSSVNGQTGIVNLTASSVNAIDMTQKGIANGVATLDSTGLVPLSQLPSTVAGVTSVNGQTGDVILTASSVNAIDMTEKGVANGVATLDTAGFVPLAQIPSIPFPVSSVNGQTGVVVLNASDIGALSLEGGILSGSLIIGPTGTAAGSGGIIQLRELAANGTNYVALKAADSIATNVIWTLPSADGTSGQFLTTNGSGTLSWGAATATTGTLVHPVTGGTNTFEYGAYSGSLSGVYNTVIGSSSGTSITSGSSNTSFGYFSSSVTIGSNNTTMGANAGKSITSGSGNTFIGSGSGLNGLSISNNSVVGYGAFPNLGIGATSNVGVGYSAGQYYASSSSYNTVINAFGPSSTSTISGSVVIGKDSSGTATAVTANNQFILGTSNHKYQLPGVIETNVIHGPIGTASGQGGIISFRELTTNGTNFVALRAPDSIPADVTWTLPSTDGTNGQVLSTNGSGTLSWTTAGGSLDPSLSVTTAGYILSSSGINTQASSYTLQASDNGRIVLITSALPATLTVPSGLNVGFNCMIIQVGAGQVTIAASGVTLNNTNGLKIAGQYGIASVIQYQSNIFAVSGYTTN